MKQSPKEIAIDIASTCNQLGWSYEVRGDILTIRKRIEKDSNQSFSQADSEYLSILGLLPSTRPGSIWGTDGGSIGGLSAINSGVFKMNMSGGSIRVLNWLKKL